MLSSSKADAPPRLDCLKRVAIIGLLGQCQPSADVEQQGAKAPANALLHQECLPKRTQLHTSAGCGRKSI